MRHHKKTVSSNGKQTILLQQASVEVQKMEGSKKRVDKQDFFCEAYSISVVLDSGGVLRKMSSIRHIVVVVIRGAGLLLSTLLGLLVARSKPPGLIMR
jgi:hypothetical protein